MSKFQQLPQGAPREPKSYTVIPLVAVIVCTVLPAVGIWLIRHDLPDPIATHWGADGLADGFSSLGGVIATGIIMTSLTSLFLLAIGAAVKQQRIVGPIAVGTAAFLAVLLFLSVWYQRGLEDPGESKLGWTILWATLIGVGVGILFWLPVRVKPGNLPKANGPLPDGAETLEVAPSTRLAFVARSKIEKSMLIIVLVSCIPLPAIGIWMMVSGEIAGGLVMFLITLGVLLLVYSMKATIVINEYGVRATFLGLITWVNLPLDNLYGSTVLEKVEPFDWGGLGYRSTFDGEQEGFITQAGPAIRIQRAQNRPFVITIEDAERASATLNTLIQRSRGIY